MQIVILRERIIRASIYGLSNNYRYEVRPGDSTSYARGRYRADRAESPHALSPQELLGGSKYSKALSGNVVDDHLQWVIRRARLGILQL